MCALHFKNTKINTEYIVQEFYKISGIKINNSELLIKALSHKSFSDTVNYERLEFLGDSILNLLTSEYLFKYYNDTDEGMLSKKKAMIVNRESLSYVYDALNLIKITLYDNKALKDTVPASIKEDIIESTLAAVYLDSGIVKAREYFEIILKYAGEVSEHFFAKNKLQEFTVKHYKLFPEFKTVSKGEEFYCELYINKEYVDNATAKSKKECEKKVALKVYNKLKKEIECE